MPINATHEYFEAEKKYLEAKNIEEQIFWLEETIRTAPKHKGSENLLKELRTRLKKLKAKSEKSSKKSGSSKKGIRKEGFQCILLGLPNTGKSSLLSKLTNAQPKIAPYQFTTKAPELGTLKHKDFQAQIIDLPAIGSEEFDFSLLNSADCLLIVINSLKDLEKITPFQHKATTKNKIIIYNKSDLLSPNELRKLEATLKSKKHNYVITSTLSDIGINELKDKIISLMPYIRVYTKEPGKPPSKDPMTILKDSTVKEAAEKIHKGFSVKVKEAYITGPSAKFSNQKTGLSHKLKDQDIIEFHTK